MVVDINRYRQTRNLGLSIPLGERIRNARDNQGMTQLQVGQRVSRDRSEVSRWETGVMEPRPVDMVAIADALHAPDLLVAYCQQCPVARACVKGQPKPAA